jgi:predicted nucleic acid-binding protein
MSAGFDVVVPAAVITESTTGDARRDAAVNRVLKTVSIEALDEETARDAGALRHAQRRRGAGAIDAMVVACADRHPGSTIYTGDPRDLEPLVAERRQSRIVAI